MLADKSGLRPKGHSRKSQMAQSSYTNDSLAEYNKKIGERLKARRMTPEKRAEQLRNKIEQSKHNINNGSRSR